MKLTKLRPYCLILVSVWSLFALAGCDLTPKPTAVSATLPPTIINTSTAEPLAQTPRPTFTSELDFETAELPTAPLLPTTTPNPTPTRQRSLSSIQLQATIFARARENYNTLFIQEDMAFVGLGNLLIILDISDSRNPELISETVLQNLIKRIKVVDNTLYAVLQSPYWGKENEQSGLVIMNISVPANPVEQAFYNTGFNALDAIIVDNVAHIIGNELNWDMVNVSNPNSPVKIGTVFEPENWPAGCGAFYQIEEVSGYYHLHVGSCRFGYKAIIIYDVSDPFDPDSIETIGSLGGESRFDADYQDNYVYTFAYGTDVGVIFGISDFSNLEEPESIGYLILPNQRDRFESGSMELVDHFIYLATSEGLLIANVLDPFNISLVGTFYPNAYLYDIVAVNGYVYLLDWDNGLVILDVSDPAVPVEVGAWAQ